MAETARGLPKWQISKCCAKQQNIFSDFFRLTFKIRPVEYRYKDRRKEVDHEND